MYKAKAASEPMSRGPEDGAFHKRLASQNRARREAKKHVRMPTIKPNIVLDLVIAIALVKIVA
jgi:hypothetical protein